MTRPFGICASQLLIDSTAKVDSAGDGLTTWGVGFKRGFGEDPDLNTVQNPEFGTAAAACLDRVSWIGSNTLGLFIIEPIGICPLCFVPV